MSEHAWGKHEREGWSVCSRCGMVRNYDKETPCRGAVPAVEPREPTIPASEHQRVVAEAKRYREGLELICATPMAAKDGPGMALAIAHETLGDPPNEITKAILAPWVKREEYERVRKALEEALAFMDSAFAPKPSHAGGCAGYITNCDGACADAVYYSEVTEPWRKALRSGAVPGWICTKCGSSKASDRLVGGTPICGGCNKYLMVKRKDQEPG